MVTEAVRAAELATSGEIVAIVAEQSDSHDDIALLYAVLAMLLVPAILAALPQAPIDRLLAALGSWNAAPPRSVLLAALTAALAAAFLIVRFALAWTPLRMALTPGPIKTRRVRRRAIELFKATAERRTHGRTGVLLLVSLAEHRAEIVADEAIASKVAPETWGDAMAALIDEIEAGRWTAGMAAAVTRIGAVLAEHFPRDAADVNELPDRLIEL